MSVLNGDELKLEGSGGGFFPIELGLKYYLSAGRFRPKLGISNGVVIARSSYILAEGNIFEGIRRTEYNSNDSKWFYNINAGFDYRLGYNWNLSTNVAYYNSAKFEDSIGGLDYYKGILMNIGLSIVF